MASHQYFGSKAARAVRKWNKLTVDQPAAIDQRHLDVLLGKPGAVAALFTENVQRAFERRGVRLKKK
jgi:hypothetical protein